MKKAILVGLVASIVIAVVVIMTTTQTSLSTTSSCGQESIFNEKIKNSVLTKDLSNRGSGTYLATDGTIAYLYDDFSRYDKNQKILDAFDDPNSWMVNGDKGKLHTADIFYGGTSALAYDLKTPKESITLSENLSSMLNLTKWERSGYITMWINIENSNDINSIRFSLEDENGNTRSYHPLTNVHTNSTNTFGNKKEYPDLVYPEGDPQIERWVDYHLTPGWNFVPWRADNFTDKGMVNMAEIQKIVILVELNTKDQVPQRIIFNDLRIQDGLQKNSNPTHGVWFPLHGRPQYGVYDIDKVNNSTELRLLNVRNTQYPLNGDSVRMISSSPVPVDFAFRTKFQFTELKKPETTITISTPFHMPTPKIPMNVGLRNNTYFRVTYDFEPDYDPGHDWFGAYISLQYDRLGLSSVWPIERNVLQDHEPKSGSKIATTGFVAHNDVEYEMDIIVEGQKAHVAIYDVNGKCLKKEAEMIYTFEHPRHEQRYPIAIESTGNMLTRIHEVEIVSLDTNSTSGIKQRY